MAKNKHYREKTIESLLRRGYIVPKKGYYVPKDKDLNPNVGRVLVIKKRK